MHRVATTGSGHDSGSRINGSVSITAMGSSGGACSGGFTHEEARLAAQIRGPRQGDDPGSCVRPGVAAASRGRPSVA